MTSRSHGKNTASRFLSARLWRRLHRWGGVVLLLPLVLLSATGALLTRPGLFREGGVLSAYAVSPADPSVRARADAVSLWVSRDGGETFVEVHPPGGVQDVVDLEFSPDGRLLYAAQRELGLLAGEDAAFWAPVPLPFDPVTGREFLERVSAPSPGRLVLRTTDSVWEGVQEGGTWRWSRAASFGRSGLYRTLHAWHSGWRFGAAGMRAVEILGWLSVLLALTGLVLFLRTGVRRP